MFIVTILPSTHNYRDMLSLRLGSLYSLIIICTESNLIDLLNEYVISLASEPF